MTIDDSGRDIEEILRHGAGEDFVELWRACLAWREQWASGAIYPPTMQRLVEAIDAVLEDDGKPPC